MAKRHEQIFYPKWFNTWHVKYLKGLSTSLAIRKMHIKLQYNYKPSRMPKNKQKNNEETVTMSNAGCSSVVVLLKEKRKAARQNKIAHSIGTHFLQIQ